MSFRDKMMSAIREIADDRVDDGSPPLALTNVKDGVSAGGRRVLTDAGGLQLAEGEHVLLRMDFKRLGLVVVHPSTATSKTQRVIFDIEKDVDVTVTDKRTVAVVDDLSTKGGWSGSGLGVIVAAGANVAHAIGSKARHRGKAAVFEVETASLLRVTAPEVSAFEWSKRRSVAFGWTEPRNLGVGELRMVLLDQRAESDHLVLARHLATTLTGRRVTSDHVNWTAQ